MVELTERGEPIAFSFETSCATTAAIPRAAREGFVDEEFVDLARAERDDAQEARLTELKRALGERVLARPASEVFEVS